MTLARLWRKCVLARNAIYRIDYFASWRDIQQMLTKQAIERVRKFRKDRGWNLSRFARAAELRESTIRKMDDDDWNPETKTLAALEAVVIAEEQANA